MDPNNNQPTNPLGQTTVTPQPVVESPVVEQAAQVPPTQPQTNTIPTPAESPVAVPNPFAPAEPVQTSTEPTPAVTMPTPAPVAPEAPAQAPTPTTPIPTVLTPTPSTSKSGSKKGIALLSILLILVLGMAGYVLFAKNQLNVAQKKSTANTSVVIPTATIIPTTTPATVDQVNVASPDADINAIEKDVQGL